MVAAFADAKDSIRGDLKKALTKQDERKVLTLVSTAIETFEASAREPLEELLAKILEASGNTASKQVTNLRAAAPAFAFDVTNPKAVAWIKAHAAETITGISDATRDAIRDVVEEAFTAQFDVDDLAAEIETLIGDKDRAESIARTETMRASNEGQVQAWDQATEQGLLTGTESKEWITTPDDRLCPVCAPMDGETVALGDRFDVDGESIDSPPAHPNCRCTVGLSV